MSLTACIICLDSTAETDKAKCAEHLWAGDSRTGLPAGCAQTVQANKQICYDQLQIPRLPLWNQKGLLEEQVYKEMRILFGTVGVLLHTAAMELLAGKDEQFAEEIVLFMGLQPKDVFHTLPDLPLQFTIKHHQLMHMNTVTQNEHGQHIAAGCLDHGAA